MKKDTIWGIIIGGVITLAVGYIFFGIGNKKREPVYSIINSPSLIFDKSNSSPKIKLLINDSLSISENVYVTTLAIWNKGKEEITKEDVRQDLIINCSDSSSQILDYKILEENESGISNFMLYVVGEKLRIGWDHFDPDYGFILQIIYTGNNKTQIVVSGSVLGAKVRKVVPKSFSTIVTTVSSFILLIVFSVPFIFFLPGYIKEMKEDKTKVLKDVGFWLLVVVFVILLIGVIGFSFKVLQGFSAIEIPF